MHVEFAYPYTSADGTQYLADESADLEAGLAASLIDSGIARKASRSTPVAPSLQDFLPDVPDEDSTPEQE